MQSFPWITVIDCLAASLFLYLFITFRDHRRRRGLSYPPGPPPLPVIGNLFDVPKRSAWVAYQAMSKQYGSATFSFFRFDSLIVSRVTRRHCMSPGFWSDDRGIVFATSYQRPAREAWGKVRRSAHVANPGNVCHTLSFSAIHLASLTPSKIRLEMDRLLPTARVGEYWREGRRLLDRSLGASATASYRRMMEDNTRMFLGRLLETPDDFLSHIGLLVWRIKFVVYNY
jgi:hypothetical protein